MDFFSLMVSTAIIAIGVILLSLAVPLLYVRFAIIMYATYGFCIRIDFRSFIYRYDTSSEANLLYIHIT